MIMKRFLDSETSERLLQRFINSRAQLSPVLFDFVSIVLPNDARPCLPTFPVVSAWCTYHAIRSKKQALAALNNGSVSLRYFFLGYRASLHAFGFRFYFIVFLRI